MAVKQVSYDDERIADGNETVRHAISFTEVKPDKLDVITDGSR